MLLTAKEPTRNQAASKLDAERAEFERIVAAGIFPPQSNCARLVEFVCRKYFEGDDNVTEYTIATEALNRRPAFTPKQDSIVRVEAHRVRKRLLEFYKNEGMGHQLQLTLPIGSYLPVFVSAEQKTELPAPLSLERPSQRARIFITIAAVVFAFIAIAVVLQRATKSKPVQNAGANRALFSVTEPPSLRTSTRYRMPAEAIRQRRAFLKTSRRGKMATYT